jgi:hypothetical protein
MGRIGSAIEMRQRPTAALLEEADPYSNWTTFDYRLQEAYYVLQKEICKTCGNPVWYCHSADERIDFDVRKGICYAAAEIADKEKGRDSQLGPGEYHYAVAVGVEYSDGEREPLPSRAEALKRVD